MLVDYCEYRMPGKCKLVLTYSVRKLCIAHCCEEEAGMAAAVGWPLLGAVQLATNAQLEAEAQLRKLEEESRL